MGSGLDTGGRLLPDRHPTTSRCGEGPQQGQNGERAQAMPPLCPPPRFLSFKVLTLLVDCSADPIGILAIVYLHDVHPPILWATNATVTMSAPSVAARPRRDNPPEVNGANRGARCLPFNPA
jgi:hypothetical protein